VLKRPQTLFRRTPNFFKKISDDRCGRKECISFYEVLKEQAPSKVFVNISSSHMGYLHNQFVTVGMTDV